MTTEMNKKMARPSEDGYSIEDKISNLPDPLLSHILSFISTRDAVRTSSLSTRWNSIWSSVSTLNLSELDFYKTASFRGQQTFGTESKSTLSACINFLDRVLLNKKMPYVKAVTIKGVSYYNTYLVKSWICAAVERNLLELDLQFDKLY